MSMVVRCVEHHHGRHSGKGQPCHVAVHITSMQAPRLVPRREEGREGGGGGWAARSKRMRMPHLLSSIASDSSLVPPENVAQLTVLFCVLAAEPKQH